MLRLTLCVFIGSGIGGICRFLLSRAVGTLTAQSLFPWPTLLVNIAGCFLIGLIYGYIAAGHSIPPHIQTLLTAGFCGGLTTFSTFSHENLLLFSQGNLPTLLLYAALSLILGLTAAAAGHAIFR